MSNEARNDMTSVWKNQSLCAIAISPEQVRGRALKLQRRILWRNVGEYLAGIVVVAAFSYYIWLFPSLVVRVGSALVIAGTLFVAHNLHKRGSARSVPADMARRTCVEFHREELVRQRDLVRSAWTWYLLPFVPGVVVFLFGLYRWTMQQPNAPAHAGEIAKAYWVTAAGMACVFAGIGLLNSWAAGKLQREIDALDATRDKF